MATNLIKISNALYLGQGDPDYSPGEFLLVTDTAPGSNTVYFDSTGEVVWERTTTGEPYVGNGLTALVYVDTNDPAAVWVRRNATEPFIKIGGSAAVCGDAAFQFEFQSFGSFTTDGEFTGLNNAHAPVAGIDDFEHFIIDKSLVSPDGVYTNWVESGFVANNIFTITKVEDPSVFAIYKILSISADSTDNRDVIVDLPIYVSEPYTMVDGEMWNVCWTPTEVLRFAVADEDDTAGEDRAFDATGFPFSITGATTLTIGDSVVFNTYGAGTHTGTDTFLLGVDASGNVIEVDAGSGSGGGAVERFGVAGEDDTAAEERQFSLEDTHSLYIVEETIIGNTRLAVTPDSASIDAQQNFGGDVASAVVFLQTANLSGIARMTTQITGNSAAFVWLDAGTVGNEDGTVSIQGLGGITLQAALHSLVVNADGSTRINPITATQASAITPAEGMMVFVNSTDATFTQIGFWGYENGTWNKF